MDAVRKFEKATQKLFEQDDTMLAFCALVHVSICGLAAQWEQSRQGAAAFM